MMRHLLLLKACCTLFLTLFLSVQAFASVTLNATNFPDANFRAALASYAVGGVIDETTLTELDVSGQGITDITGVELLTALTKFVAANNDIQFVRLTGNTHLEWLDLSGNNDLLGFSVNTATASNHYINLTPSSTPMPLKHLDLSDCNVGYFQAISGTYGVTTLTWLSLANDSRMSGWSSGISAQTGLVYCDLTNTGQTSTSVAFTSAHSSIETLILKDNSIGAVSCLQYLTNLKYLDLSNTGQSQSSSLGLTSAHTSLETLKLSGNTSFGWSSSIRYLSALKYLDISNCDIYFREGTSSTYYLLHYLTPTNNPNLETLLCSSSSMGGSTEGLTGFDNLKTVDVSGNGSMTQFWVNECPNIESVNITGCTALTYFNLIDDGLPRNNFTLTTGSTTYSSLVTANLNSNSYGSVAGAMSELSVFNALKNLYLESNSGFDGLDYVMAPADFGGLQGLDLGRNSFKSFKADSIPSTLTTLLLGNSTTLESVEIHKAAGLTSLGSTNGLGSSSGVGLYLLGNTALTHLDLENISSPLSVTALSDLTALNYLNLGYTGQAQYSTLGLTSAHTNLETLKLKGNSSFAYSSSFAYLSALKYLDISNCDIIFRTGGLLDYLTPTNNPYLETLLCSNSRLGTRTEGLDNFENLKTVDVSGNVTTGTVNMTQFWVNGSPLLDTLDISGNTALTYLKLNDDNLPRTNFHLIGGSDCTALNSLYLNGNNYASVGDATSDFSSISNLAFLYLENNSGFTGGALTMTASDCGSLTGLDLGNNGFTSFSAPELPASLTALMLGDNPGMTRLEMHNNPGITTMTVNPVMSDGSGLYLLGDTALTYMDISGTAETPNHFQRIGNNFSLASIPIDTLKASHNKFYTFRNLNAVAGNVGEHWGRDAGYYIQSGTTRLNKETYPYYSYWPASPAQADSASLEQLTSLRYLDLSHCQLKDSVYLHKNTELRHLDVSHNRSITRYTSSQDKGAGYRASGGSTTYTNQEYADYKKYLWLADVTPKYPGRQVAYDQEYYTMDYNDTTGLYILDLLDNNKLEYLDISYTGIEQTALTHCHVALARYIWIQDLPNLKYFYADYNGMRSLGVSTKNGKRHQEGLKNLERLSAIGMRGADVTTMQGSINLHGDVNTKLHYVNLSYSDYDSIGTGTAAMLDTLIIVGNPIHYLDMQQNNAIVYIDARECAFDMRGYDPETQTVVGIPATIVQRDINATTGNVYNKTITMNGARNGGSYSGTVTTPFSGLRAIRAHSRPALTTVKLNKCNGLNEVYCHYDPELIKIEGFEQPHFKSSDPDSLYLVWVNDDYKLIELNLSQSSNLTHLHAFNDKLLGDSLAADGMDLTHNQKLITAWVSNSHLQKFENGAATLDTLKIWDNPKLGVLEVTGNKSLRYLDLRNCRVRNLDMRECGILTYFDCKNDSIKGNYEDKWYDKFAAMEKAMEKVNSKQNALAGLFGTG